MDFLKALHDKLDGLRHVPDRIEAVVAALHLTARGLGIMSKAQDDFKAELDGFKAAVTGEIAGLKADLAAAASKSGDTSAADAILTDAKGQIAALLDEIKALIAKPSDDEPVSDPTAGPVDPNVDQTLAKSVSSGTGALASGAV